MDINFELLLTLAVFVTGLICVADLIFFAPRRTRAARAGMSLWVEYSRSFFPVLLLVLLLRSFVVEPFRIPSGSDIPTLLVGDFIVVNKFAYGLRLPVLHTKIWAVGEPKEGDIAIFRFPLDSSKDFIKRIVGVPGDKISYINKVLYVNGKEATQTFVKNTTDEDERGTVWDVQEKIEDLNGVKHFIYVRPAVAVQDFTEIVPPGMYYAMGDNRDDSDDSRYWGTVPEANFVGKAFAVWLSWNVNGENMLEKIRWDRIGLRVN